MNTMTNYIQFEADDLQTAKGTGRISTLDRDVEITVVPNTSDHPKAPSHQVYAKSPGGYDIPVGGIWHQPNASGEFYFSLSIKSIGFNANLGRHAGQDDASLQAIIPWQVRPE